MSKNKSLLIPIILIFIMSTFPLTSAMQGKVYGENKLPNFSKGANDKLTFEVLLSPSEGHDLLLDEIYLYFPSFGTEFSFESNFCIEATCENVNDPNLPSKRCKCVSNWDYDNPLTVTFRYDENNNGNIDSSVNVNFYPDYKKPFFEEIILSQHEDGVKFDYKVRDEACNNCNTCSGIKEIIVSDANGPRATFEINSSSCYIQDSKIFDYDIEGSVTFNFLVKDRLWSSNNDLNHQSISTRNIYIDFTPPVISSNFNVYKNNKKITHISSQGLSGGIISFTINEPNLDKISASLSSLGNNNDIPLSSYSNYCNLIENNLYNCSFNNIHINHVDASFEVTAIDTKNNKATSILNSNLILDDEKPFVDFIGTTGNYETQSYVKNGENTFIVKINENNSGISKENVLLNLGSFNLGNNVRADECVRENSQWVCYWVRNLNVQDGQSYSLSLGTSQDNAGNHFEGISHASVIADTQKPIVESIEIFAIGELGERTYFQSNDILNIRAYVKKEGSPLKSVKADFSEIYASSESLVDGSCSLIDDQQYLCQWQTSQIKAGYYLARLNFYFEDVALNVEEIQKSIPVYGISTNVPNNFHVNVNEREIIPRSINRQVASLLPNPPGYKIIIPFTLSGGGNDINILNYYVDSCLVDGDISPYENLFKDSRNPTPDRIPLLKATNQNSNSLEFTMGHFVGADLNLLNDFEVSCQIYIYQSQRTHNGYFTFAHPEVKNITFNLKVSGSALDDNPSEKIIDKIQKKREGIIKDTKFITDTAQFITQLENMCSYASKLMGVWGVFASLESLGASLVLASNNQEQFRWVYNLGCNLYEGYGSLIAPLYYGSSYGTFSRSRCPGKLQQYLSSEGASSLGEMGRNPDSPSLVSGAFKAWTKDGGGFNFPGIRNICGFVTCEYSTALANNISRYTGGDTLLIFGEGFNQENQNFFTSLLSFPRNAPSFNPRNSFIMSAVTLCVPGMFYNLNKYRQIECDYVKCLKETSIAGGPISICDDQRKQNYCLVFFGEAYETIGILRFISAMGNSLTAVAIDFLPQGAKALWDIAVCNTKSPENTPTRKVLIAATCTIPRAIHNLIDSYNRVKGLGRYAEADTWKFSRRDIPDSCEIILSDDFIEGLALPSLNFGNETDDDNEDNDDEDLDT